MARIFSSATAVLVLAFAGLWASATSAKVSAHVYLADEMTPLPLADPNVTDVYRDIMVGTKLTLFISSDTPGRWSGLVWLSSNDAANGSLAGRDYNATGVFPSYEGSCLEAAGSNPRVFDSHDSRGVGLSLIGSWDATIGDWFVLDYRATGVGACCIGLYTQSVSGDPNGTRTEEPGPAPEIPFDLLQIVCFNQVISRDFSGDAVVDFADFAILANGWMDVEDAEVPVSCDLDADGVIAFSDIALFSEYWLERTEVLPVVSNPIEPNVVP